MRIVQTRLGLCGGYSTCIGAYVCGGCLDTCKYCLCPRRNQRGSAVVCGSSEALQDWLRDIGGTFGFHDIQAPAQAAFDLPPYIPGVKYQAPDLSLPDHPVYAVSFDTLVTPSQAMFTEHAWNVREHIGIPNGAKVLWTPFETDRRLENFWTRHRALMADIGNLDVHYAASPNFSVYGNQPRMYHLLNMKRSLIIYAKFAGVGLLAMPHVYWWRTQDIERWAEWLSDNQDCEWIAVNLQTMPTGDQWRTTVNGLSMLSKLCDRPVKLLVAGVASAQRLEKLSEVGWRISVTHQRAHFLAVRYRIIEEDETERKVQGMSYESMLVQNIEVYSRMISEALQE